MPNLDEEDCEVVDEDEGRGEAVRELDDVVVGHPAPLLAGDDLDRVEEPHVRSTIFGNSSISRNSRIHPVCFLSDTSNCRLVCPL